MCVVVYGGGFCGHMNDVRLCSRRLGVEELEHFGDAARRGATRCVFGVGRTSCRLAASPWDVVAGSVEAKALLEHAPSSVRVC